jgi:hypothetical protein
VTFLLLLLLLLLLTECSHLFGVVAVVVCGWTRRPVSEFVPSAQTGGADARMTKGGHRALHFLDWTSTLAASGLANTPPLSLVVKIDVEGSEWAVLESMADSDFATILQLDLELHWCMPRHGEQMGAPLKRKIERQLLRLHSKFYVTGRFAKYKEVYTKARLESDLQVGPVDCNLPVFPQFAHISSICPYFLNLPSESIGRRVLL